MIGILSSMLRSGEKYTASTFAMQRAPSLSGRRFAAALHVELVGRGDEFFTRAPPARIASSSV
jgi:hypothetical protein